MEAVYYAARANFRRLLTRVPQLDTQAVCPSGRPVGGLGQEMEQALAPSGA